MITLPRHRRLVHAAPLLAAVVVSGAGCDSLLGEAGLGGTFLSGAAEPADPSWELRWFDGSGVRSPCDLLEPGEGSIVFDYDFGILELPPPTPAAPVGTIDEGTFAWALALMVLVDADADEDRPASDADPTAGVWGLAPLHALLHVTGDLQDFEAALQPSSLDGAALSPGFQTVEIFPDQVVSSGSFVGALALADPTITFTQEAGAVVADPLEFVDSAMRALVVGEGLGGVVFEACP